LEVALHHRPTVLASSAALTILAFLILPTIPSEMLPETDEGEVSVSARLPAGTRIERAEAVALQMEEVVRTNVPEAVTVISNAGGGGFMGGSASSVRLEIQLAPRDQRSRTSDQIATDLRRVLVGIPGAQITTRASGGNRQMTRLMGGGGDSRLAVEVRGDDLDTASRLARGVVALMNETPGVASPQLSAEEGRPEMAIRV